MTRESVDLLRMRYEDWRHALGECSPVDAAVIVLLHLFGWEQQRVGDWLEVSYGRVQQLAKRGLETIDADHLEACR